MRFLLIPIFSNTILSVIPYPTIRITHSPLTNSDKKILSTLDNHFFPSETRNFKDELKTLFSKFKRKILPEVNKDLLEKKIVDKYEYLFRESDAFNKLKNYKPHYNFLEMILIKPRYISKGYAYIEYKMPDEYVNTLFDLFHIIILHVVANINFRIEELISRNDYKINSPELYKFSCFFQYLINIMIIDIRIQDLKYQKYTKWPLDRIFYPEKDDRMEVKKLQLQAIENYYYLRYKNEEVKYIDIFGNETTISYFSQYHYVTSKKKEKIKYMTRFIYESIEHHLLNLNFETVLWYAAACYNNKLWKTITDLYEKGNFETCVFNFNGTMYDDENSKILRDAAQIIAYQQLLNRKK